MDFPTIQEVYSAHWQQGYGSVSPREIEYIQDTIAAHKPAVFLEVGMASGLSGGFIARILEENGGRKLITVDFSETFFADRTKPVGYLIGEIYQGDAVTVERRTSQTALDLHGYGETYDMAFVDANHQHPWPTIDTLALAPLMGGSKTILHHDMNLYLIQKKVLGIGPKYLFDQFPESHRHQSTANNGNIFLVRVDMPTADLEALAIRAFHLPWSIQSRFDDAMIAKIKAMMVRHYSPKLLAAFEEALEKYNAK